MTTDTDTQERALFVKDMTDRLFQCPNGRYPVQAGYMLAGFGQHRDSEPLERANYLEAMRLICEAAGQDVDDVPSFDSHGDEIYVEPVIYGSWGHWAVGWVEELLVRVDHDVAVTTAFRLWRYKHREHPVLNDDLLMEIEWEDNHPGDGYCYSDAYSECPCKEEPA